MTPMHKYNIILADPPWHYRDKKGGLARLGGIPYPTMTVPELCSLNIEGIAAEDCVLFMWATMPKLMEVHPIFDAWGFEYKTCAFSWVKLNPKSSVDKQERDVIIRGGIYSGMGHYTNQNVELCLLAKRGKMVRLRKDIKSVVLAPRGNHSAKPSVVREHIVQLYGDLPRIELFARERVEGWDCLGHGVDGMDIRTLLPERAL
jgi:N6-adenosine-specific RNA methylase IME4